jgi:hypothetical protein
MFASRETSRERLSLQDWMQEGDAVLPGSCGLQEFTAAGGHERFAQPAPRELFENPCRKGTASQTAEKL